MRKLALVILAVLIVLLAAGCPSPTTGKTTVDHGTGGSSTQHDELFVTTDNQTFSFSTKDTAYWGPDGYSLWTLRQDGGQSPFVSRRVNVVKSSGNDYAGYGVIFCQYDTGDSRGESMLVVMINTQRQYSVGEVTGSSYAPFTTPTWIQSPSLHNGYGVSNEIGVTGDGVGQFTLTLNGTKVMAFTDGRLPLETGGGDGYLAVISPHDSFPLIPVSVSYTEQ